MNNINLNTTSFMLDSWYFEVPLILKPTYLNMDIDLFSIKLTNLTVDIHWNIHELQHIFGVHLNSQVLIHGNLNFDGQNSWVWFPNSKGKHLSSKIYSFYNSTMNQVESWKGWSNIWHLKVAPQVKYFIWLIFHGKLKTNEYLYHLNLGFNRLFTLCDQGHETTEYLFFCCDKVQAI